MATFKNGDKVKIPTIGTAYIKTSAAEIRKALFDYKLDYLYVCQVWEKDGEIAVMRGDGVELSQDLYHERDLEHYSNQITPELNGLLIDFDKVETIEEAGEMYGNSFNYNEETVQEHLAAEYGFIAGAKSDTARNYWYQKFNEEQKGQNKN